MTIQTTYTFYRDEKALGTLTLHLTPGQTVYNWTWEGDPRLKRLIRPRPWCRGTLEYIWNLRIESAAQRRNLLFSTSYVGHEHFYVPDHLSDEAIDELTGRTHKNEQADETQRPGRGE